MNGENNKKQNKNMCIPGTRHKTFAKIRVPRSWVFSTMREIPEIQMQMKNSVRFLRTGIIVITSGGVPLISVRINILTETRRSFFDKLVPIDWPQEPITRSLQLPHIPVTAFSQTDLFLV